MDGNFLLMCPFAVVNILSKILYESACQIIYIFWYLSIANYVYVALNFILIAIFLSVYVAIKTNLISVTVKGNHGKSFQKMFRGLVTLLGWNIMIGYPHFLGLLQLRFLMYQKLL